VHAKIVASVYQPLSISLIQTLYCC